MFDEFSPLLDAAATPALVWLATYLLHSSVLLGAAWLLSRLPALSAPQAQDALWKTALVGGIVTASVFAGGGGWAEWAVLPAEEPGHLERAVPALQEMPALQDVMVMQEDASAMPVAVWSGARQPASVAVDAPLLGFPAQPLSVPAALGLLWLLGGLVEGLRRLRHHRRFLDALGVRARVTDGLAPLVLADLAERAGVRRPVRLTTSATLRSPVALDGWRQAEICVPGAALALPAAELRALLAHEAAHLARRDPAWLGLFALAESALWMQPLNRLARRGQQEAAESLCDGWAASQSAPTAMAGCLLQVAGWLRAPGGLRAYVVSSPVAVGMAERPSALRGRVERLLGEHPSRLGRALPAVAVVVALAGLVAGTGFSRHAPWIPNVPVVGAEWAALAPLDELETVPRLERSEHQIEERLWVEQEWQDAAMARAEVALEAAEAQHERAERTLRLAPPVQTVQVQSREPHAPRGLEALSSRLATFTIDATAFGLGVASHTLAELADSGELDWEADLDDVLADLDHLEAEAAREAIDEIRVAVATQHDASRGCAASACGADRARHAEHLREMQQRHAEHAAHLEQQAAEMERKAAELRRRLGTR